MPAVKLEVKLLEVTKDAVKLIYAACRQCYSEKFAGDIFAEPVKDLNKQEEFIRRIVASGHDSPLEHVKFTFAIEGVSRALTHQLVRHRIASFCLTGDTIIKGARQKSKGYKRFTLKSLYERTLTPHGRSRLKLIRLNSYDENRKVFDKGAIKNIVYTGKQMVWKVKLEDGQSIKSTLNHRFFTKGGWRTLEEITQTKPELAVNGVTCRYPTHSRSNGCYRTIKWVKIASIEYCGVEDTYDIEMCQPHHNFVANGFVLHNSQQSQRYVKAADFGYIIPPSIEEDKILKDKFIKIMEEIQRSYNEFLELFAKKGKTSEKANEDARFLLPQAVETKIVVTMNCRELLHFFAQRCCSRAQWEIRALAKEMLKLCRKELPAVFGQRGEKCLQLGYCPEGKQFTCGKYPLKVNESHP